MENKKQENKMKVKLGKVTFYQNGNTRHDMQKGRTFVWDYICPKR